MDFSCPHCSLALKVTPEMAGKDGRCPDCQSVFTLPQELQASAAEKETERFSVVCPSCQARLKAGREHVGVGTMCPCCETLLAISLPADQAEAKASVAPPGESFVVTCPSCAKRMWARREYEGLMSRCPGCETRFTIPSSSPHGAKALASEPKSSELAPAQSPAPPPELFQVVCPHCRATLEAGPEDLGSEAPCPACGKPFLIQTGAPASA